jgi:hypothetical protein
MRISCINAVSFHDGKHAQLVSGIAFAIDAKAMAS